MFHPGLSLKFVIGVYWIGESEVFHPGLPCGQFFTNYLLQGICLLVFSLHSLPFFSRFFFLCMSVSSQEATASIHHRRLRPEASKKVTPKQQSKRKEKNLQRAISHKETFGPFVLGTGQQEEVSFGTPTDTQIPSSTGVCSSKSELTDPNPFSESELHIKTSSSFVPSELSFSDILEKLLYVSALAEELSLPESPSHNQNT